MTLSTHVLDIARGVPASGVGIRLYALDGEQRELVSESVTNADGRTDAPLAADLAAGIYELVFAAGAYFARHGTAAMYADIPIRFHLAGETGRYHIPLLLGPWAYSTYRGS